MTFIEAAKAAGLRVENGLQALGARDRLCLQSAAEASFAGSINMDEAYRVAEGQASRWDYGIGVKVNDAEFAVWVEPHSATSTGEITTMLRKLRWLKDKLSTDTFDDLRKMTEKTRDSGQRQFWWVTRGRINIRPGTLDTNRLAKAGLNFPCRKAVLGKV